jgi:hypothetical protein
MFFSEVFICFFPRFSYVIWPKKTYCVAFLRKK